ncbi:hypothetical protein SPI_02309 [Niveomyces insectorum RCEF 264]|uniref:Methyltransferase type 11 n=1 Tax=Niveomyces insectorum RCEF 264 TaxID=1081102 RepID=A0A162J943_9HYPO|nr:hypothetical protein SPI_02309 [Niveomyces insectorum RCEF 264]
MSATTQQPAGGKSWKDLNKEHFDALPEDGFDIPWIRKMHLEVMDFLVENRAWLGIPETADAAKGTGIRLLDYACGNGVLSLALSPFATHIRGMDISSTMVQRYNEAAAKKGLTPERMRAVEVDLTGDDAEAEAAAPGPEFRGFDLALVSMALHHMEHPGAVLKGLTGRLAPGGRLLVIDWAKPTEEQAKQGVAGLPVRHSQDQDAGHDQGHGHGHNHGHGQSSEQGGKNPANALHTVVHQGFSEKEMLDLFAGAGLVEGEVRLHPKLMDLPAKFGSKVQGFYAVAQKAPVTQSRA